MEEQEDDRVKSLCHGIVESVQIQETRYSETADNSKDHPLRWILTPTNGLDIHSINWLARLCPSKSLATNPSTNCCGSMHCKQMCVPTKDRIHKDRSKAFESFGTTLGRSLELAKLS